MPTRHYWVDALHPTAKQKALAHPMELVYAAMSFVFGLMLIYSEITSTYFPSPPVSNLSYWQGYLMGGSLTVGSVIILIGLVAKLPDLEMEYLAERFGLGLCVLSWLTYGCAVYIWDSKYNGAMLLGFGMASMGGARAIITFVIRRDWNQVRRRRRQ